MRSDAPTERAPLEKTGEMGVWGKFQRLARTTGWIGGCFVAVLLAEPGRTQTVPPQTPPPAKEMLPAPRPVPPSAGPVPAAEAPPILPISLLAALRLSQTTNLDIARAREVVNVAQARLQKAQLTLVPDFNLGSQYVHHEGAIQKTEGNIETVNRDSLFVGGGPSLNFQTVEALFGPLAAQQILVGTEAGLERVNSDTFLAVANAYFNVLLARRRLAQIEETLDFLLSERPSPLRGGARGLLPLVRAVVEEGGVAARRADLARVEVEIIRRRQDWIAARQDMLTAVTELARLIRLDPAAPLWPVEDFRVPIALPGDAWSVQPLDDLVRTALESRPELAESRALVEATLAQLKTAQYRPLLPSVVLNYNWGGFGGGPDLNPPVNGKSVPGFGPSGRILHFDTRTDFDVTLVWRLQNLGFGNRAEVQERTAAHNEAMLRRLQVIDQVIAQVAQTQESLEGWRRRMELNREALFGPSGAADGPVFRSIRLDFERIRGAEGRVLELLDSIRNMSDVLDSYGTAVTGYERTRFRLLIDIGLPPQAFLHPEMMPLPPRVTPCPAPNPAAAEGVAVPQEPSSH